MVNALRICGIVDCESLHLALAAPFRHEGCDGRDESAADLSYWAVHTHNHGTWNNNNGMVAPTAAPRAHQADVDAIEVDEKWFCMTMEKRVVDLAPGEKLKLRAVRHRNFIDKNHVPFHCWWASTFAKWDMVGWQDWNISLWQTCLCPKKR